jgi:predicted AAA+ superfamily ATPase
MELIPRTLRQRIADYLAPQKAALIFGARRVGKTVLIRQILGHWQNALLLNGEDYDAQALLEPRSAAHYRHILERQELLVIDEAQAIPDIGAKLKLILDEVPHIRLIASGSSFFDLANKTGEPLVGRSTYFHLNPFTQKELDQIENPLETRQNLETRLIYGSYPETVFLGTQKQRAEYLREIVNAYLLKDILALDGLKNASKMRDLLRLIAFQTGSEVSHDELGRQLGMSRNTVEKYLDLLSKVFVIFRLGAFSQNLRKEIAKACKWYFYDNGIRNALIGNFAPLTLRQDIGALWENYCLSERVKAADHDGEAKQFYFWRTYDHQEIDLIEVSAGALAAFEFKWGDKTPKAPAAFTAAYPEATYQVVKHCPL